MIDFIIIIIIIILLDLLHIVGLLGHQYPCLCHYVIDIFIRHSIGYW